MSDVKGIKYDNDKLRWDLLDLQLIEGIVRILTFGANKYTENGWQSVPNGKERYYAALMRHLSKFRQGELIDEESGLKHIDHALTNLLFMKHLSKED